MAAQYLLPKVLVERVGRLLRHGVPKTEISRRLHLGERSVYRIADGIQAANGAEHERCADCGGLQLADEPCRVCRDRRALRAEKQCA